MTNKIISGECLECESTYEVQYVEQLVSQELPEHCPFCGAAIEDISEEYIEDDELNDNEQWD
jgi:NAD-dependent SIR2 family protein deacetylase